MALYRGLRRKVFVFFFILVAAALPVSSAADCFSTLWPHEQSELQPDPSLFYGRLDNGFRYVLKKNEEPRDRVAMSLNIQVGSLNEGDAERGMAHFLEHMLFNGSTHFPPGELVDYFQSIGMSFGGDTNAHTGYDETVYDIILPDGGREDVEKGLLVMSDYARGALLLADEIDRERGVILAEKRSRDSAEYRTQMEGLAFSMRGTMIPERTIIGTEGTLKAIGRPLMKSFYDAWYRPENMVLVMAGDFDLQEVKGLIEKKFRDLQGSGPVPPCPQLGRVQHGDGDSRYFYHHEEELGYTGTTIETLWNVEPQHDSLALQVEELTRYVANRMVQHRLDELARKSDSPFSSARIYGGTFLDRIRYGSVTAKCDPGQWQESLVLLENSLRQALEHGFTAGELQRVQKELLAELDSAVLTASSRNSRKLVSSIIRAINDDRVLFSPEQEKEIFAPVVEKMNLADVEKAFRGTWSQRNHLVSLEGNVKIAAKDPLALMASVHGRASERKVSPYIQEKLHAFPYLQLQGGQPPVSKEEFSEIESKRFVFANGLVLNLKNTDFEENEVKVSADFGLGRGSEPTPGLARLTGAVIDLSGTATLNREALERIVAGTSVKLKFHVTPAAFSWQGKALNRDLELLFQVLQSLLADPGVDDEAYQVVMDRFRKNYESLSRDVGGAMKLRGERFLAGGNPFFGVPPWSEFSKLSTEEIRKWFLPATARGPLEISLVGDFDEKEVLALAEKYFSVLSKRENGEMEQVALSFPGGESLDLTVPSSIDKGMLVVAWKTDDFWDIRRTRGLHVLAEIFSDKMRRLIREKLGATYSPQVYNVSSRIHKGYGVMRAVLVVDPEQMEMLEKEVLHLAEEMYQGTISEEELERAKGPMLTSLKDMVRTNRYWLHSVLSLSFRYPQQLQWPGTILSGFASFSLEDVQGLSRSYLNPKEAAVISVLPE